ncbi:hypothetical protein K438DRAFT_1947766 [Mycena galopus ATCC 62051]|nr:hypothetical protein K438DRAFT_1947766 [Mycena galopus ATCC 62051]
MALGFLEEPRHKPLYRMMKSSTQGHFNMHVKFKCSGIIHRTGGIFLTLRFQQILVLNLEVSRGALPAVLSHTNIGASIQYCALNPKYLGSRQGYKHSLASATMEEPVESYFALVVVNSHAFKDVRGYWSNKPKKKQGAVICLAYMFCLLPSACSPRCPSAHCDRMTAPPTNWRRRSCRQNSTSWSSFHVANHVITAAAGPFPSELARSRHCATSPACEQHRASKRDTLRKPDGCLCAGTHVLSTPPVPRSVCAGRPMCERAIRVHVVNFPAPRCSSSYAGSCHSPAPPCAERAPGRLHHHSPTTLSAATCGTFCCTSAELKLR